MKKTTLRLLSTLLFPALLLVVGAPIRAAEEEELRQLIKELNSLTGDDSARTKARELVKDKEKAAKIIKIADDMGKLDSKQFKFNAAMALAKTAGHIKNYDAALRFYKISEKQALDMRSATKYLDVFEGQLVILMVQKKFAEAEKLCAKNIDSENEEIGKFRAIFEEQLARVLTRQGKVEDALKLANDLIRDHESKWYFLRLKGSILSEAGRYEESAKAYLEAIDRMEKADDIMPEMQNRMIDSTRATLSNVFVELNQIDKAVEQLKILLKKKPDHPTYNNDLGYVWADHDMNLDEAEKLIRKALDEDRKQRKQDKDLLPEDDKDNAAYLDSLGWVLFKKKQYAEAKKVMLEAVKLEEAQNMEIQDHLADIHMALGEKAEAIAVWNKALEMEMTSKRDHVRRGEIIKKLKAAQGK